MKKFLVAAFAFILMFTEVLPSVQVNAAETTDPCEEKAFIIMPFTSGDDSLKGEGHPGEEIDLQFEDMERTIEVDEEGHFEYILEEKAPETDDTITLTNSPYEVEWTVEAEVSKREEIEAEMVDTCDVTVPTEEMESVEGEDSVEEEATEEDFAESGEAEEKETPEESTEEPSPEEEPDSKENMDRSESSEEAELTEEPVVEESDRVMPDNPTEEVSSEAPVEEKEEEMESAADSKEENPETEEKEEVKSEGDADKETDVAEEEVADKQERTEEPEPKERGPETEEKKENKSGDGADKETDTTEEEVADKQERMEETDNEEESSEETTVETKEVPREEKVSQEGRMARSSRMLGQDTVVKSAVPLEDRRGRSKEVSTYDDFISALKNGNIETVVLTSDFNKRKQSYSSDVKVDSYSGQKIVEGNGYEMDTGSDTWTIEDRITNMVIMNTGIISNNTQGYGLIRKQRSSMDLRLENITFNGNQNNASGIFGTGLESDVHFYGKNQINTKDRSYGLAFQNVIIHEGAEVHLEHSGGGSALRFSRNIDFQFNTKYGLKVMEGANVHISSSDSILQTTLRIWWFSRDISIDIKEGSTVIFEGQGRALFDLDTEVDFTIDSPKVVDFNNKRSDGILFSEFTSFEVKEVIKKDWAKGNMGATPSSESEITSGQFSLGGSSNIRRMKLEENTPPIGKFEVPEVKDTDLAISGVTVPRALVTVFNESGEMIYSKEADGGGAFTVTLDERFEAGTVLQFKAKLGNAISETVEKTVVGNRLEFASVPSSIPFETTEIKDEDVKIYRQNNNPDIEIVETREGSGWTLTCEATSSLTNGNQDTLENALYYFSAGSEPELIEGTPVSVARGTTSETIEWTRDEGILLKLNPIRAAADTEYEATIEWTLSDGP